LIYAKKTTKKDGSVQKSERGGHTTASPF